jgi:thermostable 8-oxoguanine DNA glycosylase
MIDPNNITKYDRTVSELQEFWLFCLCVAGKNSMVQAQKLNALMLNIPASYTPFQWIQLCQSQNYRYGTIRRQLMAVKMGQYDRLTEAMLQSCELDLQTCTLEHLTGLHGVGPKTARFFLVHTRQNAEYAVLDTHILKWMRDEAKIKNVPTKTPNHKQYRELEQQCLKALKKHYPDYTVAEADLLIWISQRNK